MKRQTFLNRQGVHSHPKTLIVLLTTSVLLFLLAGTASTLQAQAPPFADPVINPMGLGAPTGGDVSSRVRLVDLNNDGILDAMVRLIKNEPPTFDLKNRYYVNTGSNENPNFSFTSFDPFGIPGQIADWFASFVDIDGDGLDELFFTGWDSDIPVKMRENVGTVDDPDFSGSFIENPFSIVLPISDKDGGTLDSQFPTFVDIDSDGDFDLFLGGQFRNNFVDEAFYFLQNEDPSGNGTSPQFSAPIKNPFGLSFPAGIQWHYSAFADMDCDGDPDMYLTGRPDYNFYFENTGTSTAPDFSSAPIDLAQTETGAFAGSFIDVGGDGDWDIIQGSQEGFKYYENISPSPTANFSHSANQSQVSFTDASTVPTGQITQWLWDFGDGATSTEQNPVHSYTETNMYQVCLTAWSQCNRDTFCNTINAVVGLDENRLDASISLYPTPAKDEITLLLKSNKTLGQVNIAIFDFTGQKVKAFNRQAKGNTLQETILLAGLPNGMFTLKINSAGKYITRQFITVK